MAALIAFLGVCLLVRGIAAGIIGVVAVAIRREERNLTLTSAAPGQVASAGRWLNGNRSAAGNYAPSHALT